MVTHSSILALKIPETEEPGGLLFTGSQIRTRLSARTHRHMRTRHKPIRAK